MTFADAFPLAPAQAPDCVIDLLWRAVADYGDRPMLTVGRQQFTYAQMWDQALRIGAAIRAAAPSGKLVGFYANRDDSAYLSVLAILAAGKGYVPLNPKLPAERLRHIIRVADLGTVLVGRGVEARARDLLGGLGRPVEALCIAGEGEALAGATGVRVTPLSVIAAMNREPVRRPDGPDDPAYLLFTSGSTGEPKGVPVSNANLCAYLGFVTRRYGFGPGDVHSQTFELTFDLSVHDMMCAFTTGGRLVRFAGAELLSPAKILRREGVTAWFSVPSLGSIMARTGGLGSGALDCLRVSLFCGEALPRALATQWQEAAPQSIVENLYGPTEATIAFTLYRWNAATSPGDCRHGLVPIGRAFDGQATRVIDDDGHALARPAKGMLLLGGSQVTGRYWKAPDIDAEKYIRLAGEPDRLWYVTGDLVEEDEAGCLHFVGRLDSQIKYRGYRIELREIEDALRGAVGTDLAVVIPWPVEGHEIKGLVAVVAGAEQDRTAITGDLRRMLPDYMVPDRIRFIDELPRNLSGKIDRNAIRGLLDHAGG